MSPTELQHTELVLKILGGVGAFVLFIIGLKRYRKDQTWKRQEFIAREIKEFQNDIAVKNVMLMLDWEVRYIQLFPEKPNLESRYVKVDAALFRKALALEPLNIKEDQSYYKEDEVAIRDNMDIFLSYLDRFNVFITATLISKEEVLPYLRYWIETINNRISKDNKDALYAYISNYGFEGAEKILKEEL